MPGIGLNGTMYMASNALAAQRVGVEVTGRNLANVNTPGASRQRVALDSDISIKLGNGFQGLGVFASTVDAIRSTLLDSNVVRQGYQNDYYSKMTELTSLVQDTLGENFTTSATSNSDGITATGGVQRALNDFFDSMQKVAANPTEPAARTEFITRAQNLVSSVTTSYTRLVEVQNNIALDASDTADQVNALSTQIAALNVNISRSEIATNSKANDLRDQRQKLIEDLSKLVSIKVSTNATNGSMVDVEMTDINNNSFGTPQFLVAGIEGGGVGASVALSTDTTGGNAPLRVIATGTGSFAITSTLGGQLGADVEVSRNQIGTIATSGTLLGNLNTFASTLITQVNTLHTAGFDLNNNAGLAIFTGANITNIAFNTAINSPNMIAASDTTGQILNGANANAIAQLRETDIAGLGNRSLLEYHRGEVVLEAGFNAQQAKTNSDAQSVIYKSAVQQQNSLSGISVDEEMTNLTSFQRAFEASARFLETLDEMINRIVNGI